MTYKLIIQGRLPCLNDYIKAMNSNRHVGNTLKQDTQNAIGWQINQQLRGVCITSKVKMHYTWIEPNMKRDLDGITIGKKFIQDSLVNCGVLKNDGWANVGGFSDSFSVDKNNPRIEVLILEIEGD